MRRQVSRRSVLIAGVGVSTALAGCLGDEDEDPSDSTGDETDGSPESDDDGDETDDPPESDDDGDETDGESSEDEESDESDEDADEEDPTPTLAAFDYPDGASESGIQGSALFSTHESTLVDGGSVTIEQEIDTVRDNFEDSRVATNKLDAGAISIVSDEDGVTETMWSPSSEQVAYVQMEQGFESGYRIDNDAPSPTDVATLREFESLLTGLDWSDALEVVEIGDEEFGVRYESVGIADERQLSHLARSDSITDFQGVFTLTADGYLRDVSYETTAGGNGREIQREVDMGVRDVGETVVEEPSWTDEARADGIQFTVTVRADDTIVELELVNGGVVPASARVDLFTQQGGNHGQLPGELTVGDRLNLGLSEDSELVMEINDIPDDATPLEGFVNVFLRNDQFSLLEADFRL